LPVVLLELVQALAVRVSLEEQPSHATLEHSPDAVWPVPGEARAFRGFSPIAAVAPQTLAAVAVALS
jgi:hypothetical protein